MKMRKTATLVSVDNLVQKLILHNNTEIPKRGKEHQFKLLVCPLQQPQLNLESNSVTHEILHSTNSSSNYMRIKHVCIYKNMK